MGTILKFHCYGAVRLCQPDGEKIFWLKQRHTLIKTLHSNTLQHLSRHQRCLIHWPQCHPFEPPRKSGSRRWNSPGDHTLLRLRQHRGRAPDLKVHHQLIQQQPKRQPLGPRGGTHHPQRHWLDGHTWPQHLGTAGTAFLLTGNLQ